MVKVSSFLSDTLHLRSSAAIGWQLSQWCCDRSGAIPQSAVLSDDSRHGSGNGRLALLQNAAGRAINRTEVRSLGAV